MVSETCAPLSRLSRLLISSFVSQLRKISRRLSPHNSDIFQSNRASIDLDDKTIDDNDDDTSTKYRRSSEPVGLLSPSHSSFTPSVSGRGTRHASVPEESPSSNRLQPQSHGNGTLETPPLLDSLGLSLVHTCTDPLADLIFVHGLGGASRRTWSWQRDPQNFWPTWLSQEAELCKSRIFTFGYNADFSRQDTPLNILDFAKELLFQMKTYSNAQSVNDQPIGKVSMRGFQKYCYATHLL
jgi:hypothetical protein